MRTASAVSALALALASAAAADTDQTFSLRAVVPVYCDVQFRGTGGVITSGQSVSLGTFREYCNAPGGYTLVVRYEPGTLKGAVISADMDQVVLDGSGEAVLSRAQGPRFRNRTFFATPGGKGFDTDRIRFDIMPVSST